MSITSHDVARLAGVSQPTVSRALRGDPRVAVATRQRVVEAAAELGYVASELGRSLSTRTTHQIAMVADLRNALYPTLVEPLHDRFAEHGLRMVLLAERGDDRRTYERLLDRSVDGVVLTTTLIGSSLSKGLLDKGVPFVELNRLSGRRRIDGVTADNAGGAAAVARLLLDAGHRRIAAVFGSLDTSTGRERERGFRAALAEAGVELPESRISRGGFGYADGERGLAAVFSGRHRPTAVFCVGDLVAVGALNQARRLGLSVPGDIAIVGFDDIEMAGWPCFNLTTARIDLAAMAVAAADLLIRRLGGATGRAELRTFPAQLVLRGTHG
ncbi:MAG TPA: LacI family DNA-binding transcriptional regulator [Jatrophihabitans sp.]|nr:LacI family DNA-binding transcriptional regulator [Jatrophihabitans sp.]